MRETKFKAWIPDLKHMVEVYEIVFTQKGCSIRIKRYDYRHYKTFKYGEFILRQYTGLKDKNDVEIYEGDIVIDTYGDWPELKNNTGCVVDLDPNSYNFIYNQFDYKGFLELVARERIEVIGNVYENPELLEDI